MSQPQRAERILTFATLRLPGPIAATSEVPTNFDLLEDAKLLGINWQVSLGGGAIVRQAQLRIEIYSDNTESQKRLVPYKTGVSIAGGSAVAKEFRFRNPTPVKKGERIKMVDVAADALLAGEEYGSAKELIAE